MDSPHKQLLEKYKIAFLCSRKCPADIILKSYDWAIEQREKGVCVISGFHSKTEKEVLHYLLKGHPCTGKRSQETARTQTKEALDKTNCCSLPPFVKKLNELPEKLPTRGTVYGRTGG